MKAAIYTQYGPPEVAQIMEVLKPVPKENEILIRIVTSTVNRTDSGFRSAEYFISRFWSGLFKPKYQILGCEFAGSVEQIGKEVSLFKVGDKVFGFNDKTFGGHAEYLTIAESDALTTIPINISLDKAAAITEGAHYALNIIRAAKVKRGQQVLVNGATGAIGSAGVQLLKHFGAVVTAVSNTQNLELVRNLGADMVIDYQSQDFTKAENKFDFIFDAVGKSSFRQCKPLLTAKGIYISTELGNNCENVFYALIGNLKGGRRVMFPIPEISKQEVEFLKKLVEKDEFTPVVDLSFQLSEIVEAYQYVELGQKTGNVLLKIQD